METLRKEHKDRIKSFETKYPNKKGSDLKEEVFIELFNPKELGTFPTV